MADAANVRGTSDLRVALIGAGRQGLALLEALANPAAPIPGVRVIAVCDIWDFARERAVGRLRDAGQTARGYTEWTDLLAREHDLDAVFIATPDRSHAAIALAAIGAGLHVYVEPMLAQNLDDARRLIRAAKRNGRLVQAGYDRRSHPRYTIALNRVWREAGIVGMPTDIQARHHERDREVRVSRSAPPVPAEALRRHGYTSMHELLNWARSRRHAGHLLPRMGPYQLDTISWFLGTGPRTVLAAGGRDFHVDRDVLDNAFAILAFDRPGGRVRASYQASSLTSAGGAGCWERFAGSDACVSLPGDSDAIEVRPSCHASYGIMAKLPFEYCRVLRCRGLREVLFKRDGPLTVTCSEDDIEAYGMVPTAGRRTRCQPHVENFLAALRGDTNLNAPVEAAFVTEVVVRKIAEAIAAKRELELTAADFDVADPAPPAVAPPVPALPVPRVEWIV